MKLLERTTFIFIMACCFVCAGEEVTSPDKNIVLKTTNKSGKICYSVDFKKGNIIAESPLGLSLIDGSFSGKLTVVNSVRGSHDPPWDTVWGENKTYRDHYNELILNVEDDQAVPKKMQIIFRAFNDGIAFRYIFPKQVGLDTVTFAEEKSTVAFISDAPIAWHPLSSVLVSDPVDVNNLVLPPPSKKKTKKGDKNVRGAGRTKNSMTPFTVKLSDDRYISLHEAALEKAGDSYVSLDHKAHSLKFMGRSTQSTPAMSAWRTVTITDSAAGLIESSMCLNLNEPCALKDTSWIKPGKTMWDWRNHGAIADDGFEYAMTTESYIRYIDFASENHVEYVMVDAGWYGPERNKKSDPKTYLPQVDIPKICAYATSKDIGLWLYVNSRALEYFDLDQTLSLYKKWGVVGIKQGFLSGDTQRHVEFADKVMKKCAEYKIMYVLHEPNKPTGMRRTYPHYLSREFVNSMLDSGVRPSATPTTLCTFPFVHNLAGPVDRSCGMFDLDDYISRKKCHRQLPTTVASQLAQCLIYPSGLLTLPDHPDAYRRKLDLFEFIAELPMTYDETRVLHAEIGHLITMARRNGSAWFISSLADENGRSFDLTLDFLEEGVSYDATLYEDGEGADYHYAGMENKKAALAAKRELVPVKTTRELYTIRKKIVRKDDVIRVKIAPGGGHNLWIRPVK
ncbi:glycoside hydrolase family 97 protein [Pontiella agarivorans]|uniref:Glycoside hydrolase family 97 catalytic domain-containing protein n=1 Tax=Pontiella agarivorans TaxID=3038953 RepID=A0ABU5N0T6_9BACT|nr:glycoside hydrolase family 97 catalytic domain-containing protein [Pontiella agarivorans]MDZ8120038.1 glycoside hydrolase family 97 catalytic domain-containing protein [Pontiella agarivorans]